MKTIPFSYNWNNKLHCKYFTTLRLSAQYLIGEQIIILLKGKQINQAEIIDKKWFYLRDLKLHQCCLDTGYGIEETQNILKKMYPKKNWDNTPIYYYLLKTI